VLDELFPSFEILELLLGKAEFEVEREPEGFCRRVLDEREQHRLNDIQI